MKFSLPKIEKDAIELTHFPTKHQAFIFRAYEYIPAKKIGEILGTTEENVHKSAAAMGLPYHEVGDIWLKRGHITIVRSMWHILPYEQLFELLDMDEQSFAKMLRHEDFFDIKLSEKPRCAPVKWRELTEEERARTAEIRKIVSALDLNGRAPFDFKYEVPKLEFSGKEIFETRIIYPFSGLYMGSFDVDSEEFLPDEMLEAYQKLGINGIWLQGILSQLAPFPFEPSLSRGYEERLERVKALTERLDKYGIKLYMYLNEPRSMPASFFENHPDIKGHVHNEDTVCLCTSTKKVQDYIKDSVELICRAAPLIGGFIMTTRSENKTNCYSHTRPTPPDPCECPRCSKRLLGDVIAEVIGCVAEGAHRVNKDIKIMASSWAWHGDFRKEIIDRLPKDVILQTQSQRNIRFEIGGVKSEIVDFSLTHIGPGEVACEEWEWAKERGLEITAYLWINTSWECSTVPALPITPLVEKHIEGIREKGVKNLMVSWTLGGYPSRNIAAAASYFYEKSNYQRDPVTYAAEEKFAEALGEFPFHCSVLYRAPQNAGPSNLLYEKPTGYKATMTCFAYDDLESWRYTYPVDVFEKQFAKLCEKWEAGLRMLPEGDTSEMAIMARSAYCLFKSSLNQIRFVRARDDERYADAIEAAKDEITVAKEMVKLMNQNAAIGYEAANHYYFSKGQIVEKIVNCNYIIEQFSKKQ